MTGHPHRSLRLLAIVVLFASFAAVASGQQTAERPAAKYIFLFIGDGMGPAQRSAAELYLAGPATPGQPYRVPALRMNRLPVSGMARTHPYDNTITDSAASATAMATGHKTRNGRLSVDPVNGRPLPTFAEIVKAHHWKVGMVSSSDIDDATPAAFYAHELSRGNRYEIANALADSGFDFFAGGKARGSRMEPGDTRPSPIDRARDNGFRIVNGRDNLLRLRPGDGPVWAFQYATDETGRRVPAGMDFDSDRAPDDPSLADYTRKAIELLDNPRGFFLMVEGGLTDAAGHWNDLASCVREVLALDRAVAQALAFYALHPDETLIIVTADHETGGLSLGGPGYGYALLTERVDGQKLSWVGMGKKVAEWRAAGTTFDDALPQIKDMMGWTELSDDELAELRAAYAESMKGLPAKERTDYIRQKYGRVEPVVGACLQKVSRDAGVSWGTYGHTAMPVATTAIGVGAERFSGYYDNTDTFRFLLSAAGLPIPADAPDADAVPELAPAAN